MPGPIVSLPALEQIIPKHCRPLWRNDKNLDQKWLQAESSLLQQYTDSRVPQGDFWLLDNYNMLLLTKLEVKCEDLEYRVYM